MASSGLFSRSPGCGQSLPQTSRSGAALTRFFIEEGAEAQDDRGIHAPFDGVQRRRGGRPIDPLHEIPIVSERRQQLVTIKRPMQRKGDDVQRL